MLSRLIILAAALFEGAAVAATCGSNLKIDDFANWSKNTNSLGGYTSDDGSTTNIAASSNVLSFTAKSGSYFYESFECQQAKTGGYGSLKFDVKGVKDASFTLELQTKKSCTDSAYTSYYVNVASITGSWQTIDVPLTNFAGANADAVTGLVVQDFSKTGSWKLRNVYFGCGSTASNPTTAASATPTSSKSAAATATGKVSTDGTCGGTAKYTCVGFSEGECCSQYGWCGKTDTYCGTGCNPLYGKCSSPGSSSGSSSISATPISSKAAIASSKATTLTTAVRPSGTCAPLLIDDFVSQSRLTFLFYNAMLLPTSDDGSMTSVVVSNNRATYTPKDTSSYWYTQFGCTNAKDIYGGISFRLKAPKGTTFAVQLESSSTCDPSQSTQQRFTTTELGWTFDGTEKLYTVPFSKYNTLDLSKLTTFFFDSFTQAVTYGPMAFYCGDSKSEYVVSTTTAPAGPSSTVAAPSGTASALVVDKFASADSNALGFWHGYDEGMSVTISGGKAVIKSDDSDYSFYSQLSASCTDYTKYKGSYLHIAYSGTVAFTVALQQHNSQCKDTVAPFPATWDSLEASRYAKDGHIYMPMSHFNIDLALTVGIALKGFYKSDQVTLSVIEIVPAVPASFQVPNKLESGNLVFACTRPNSFAFAIDDGSPEYAQEVLRVIKEEDIKVTFFTVGAPLLDDSTNLTNVYKEMEAAGHQIALHSYTHPKMEGLPDYAAIDWEYQNDIDTVKKQFNGYTTSYFRPPFGTEGARMRQRLPPLVPDVPKITMWSVDVEDWLWAETDTPEQQKVSFQRDVDAGGNLVVMHYLYPSTVSYLQEFIQIAKKTGKQLMRVDQCMEDPNAPAL